MNENTILNTNNSFETQTQGLSIASLVSSLDEKLTEEVNIIPEVSKEDEAYQNILNLISGLDEKKEEEIIIKEEPQTVFSTTKEIKISYSNDLLGDLNKINSQRKWKSIGRIVKNNVKFLASYIFISTIVFIVLLGGANYSAYGQLLNNLINPGSLKNSSAEILTAIDNSRVKVYADEDNKILNEKEQASMQESLSQENVQLRDTYFSPKKLVPLNSNVDLSVEIMPYENRIVIPKIGKNIPLVNVDARQNGLSFDNLEEIFMRELEKGVIRYPGTAKPGENGNAFIFGHSSNYPWIKGDFNDVFALLDNLENGDEIIFYYNQKKYTYVVNDKKVIKPGNVKALETDPTKKEVSLMTCWPIGTSYSRLIVFGELKEVK